MAREAVRLGSTVGVVGTVASTMGPSTRLVERMAKEAGKEVRVTPYLAHGALDILMIEKNQEKHNRLVLAAIEKACEVNDVAVLAQGSMTVMIPYLKHMKKPVLTSPRMAVEYLKTRLQSYGKDAGFIC